MTVLMAKIAFGGGGDPDLAAAELERLGYTVHRLPPEYEGRLGDPLDDHLEAVIGVDRNDDKTIRAIMDEVADVVDEHGGFCLECGPLEPNHPPFDYLFSDGRPR